MDTVLLIKIISALIYPLGLVSIFTIFCLACRLTGKRTAATVYLWLAAIVLVVSSNPLVAKNLVASLENQYPQRAFDSISEHDAIIVLGGGLRIPTVPAKHVQLGQASDRYWHAAQLFKAGKASKIIVSGGNTYQQPGLYGEAYYAAQLLQKWGVPEHAITLESSSRTTAQNQSSTLKLLRAHEVRSALLVTSAIHMPRAHYLFSRLPILITPASADVLVRQHNSPIVFNYLPSATALGLTTVAMHEYYGYWFQRLLRGEA